MLKQFEHIEPQDINVYVEKVKSIAGVAKVPEVVSGLDTVVKHELAKKIDINGLRSAINKLESNFSNNCCQSVNFDCCQSCQKCESCQDSTECSGGGTSCQGNCTECISGGSVTVNCTECAHVTVECSQCKELDCSGDCCQVCQTCQTCQTSRCQSSRCQSCQSTTCQTCQKCQTCQITVTNCNCDCSEHAGSNSH